jgi:polysaccharide deacetylase family protein (PEP-CTERM system associated)
MTDRSRSATAETPARRRLGRDVRRLERPEPAKLRHYFTVDVEEYFQVSALEPYAPREKWRSYPSRVEPYTDMLLEMLDAAGHTATFFVLGWVAERRPELVKRIAEGGHEIASHGWGHRRVTELSRDEFRTSIRRSRALLSDLTGHDVVGYRAPSFSIIPGLEWTFDILLEEGYTYDSSLLPVRRPGAGYGGIPREPFRITRAAGTLLEFPIATWKFMGATVPAGGGAYLRLLPPSLVHAAVEQLERAGSPAMLYIHPWEFDPDQPRFDVPWLTRIRHYGGVSQARARVDRLLREFDFTTIASTLSTHDRGRRHNG